MKNTGDWQIIRYFSTPTWFRNRANLPYMLYLDAEVYVLWTENQMIDAGMSGMNIEKQGFREKYGSGTRYESPAKGG